MMFDLKFAVIDDDINHQYLVAEEIERSLSAYSNVAWTIEIVNNINEFIEDCSNCFAVFVDIKMPEITGFDVLEQIRKNNKSVKVILMTGEDDILFSAFHHSPYDTVRKSDLRTEIAIVVAKLMSDYYRENAKINFQNNVVFHHEILYFESDRNNLYCVTNRGRFEKREALHVVIEWIEKWSLDCFVRINKSFIINVDYLNRIDGYDVILTNGSRLPIAINKRKKIVTKLQNYCEEKYMNNNNLRFNITTVDNY